MEFYDIYIEQEQEQEDEPKIKMPIPYKINKKLEKLKKSGSEKIVDFIGSNAVETMFYLYLFKKYKTKCLLRYGESNYLGINIVIQDSYTELEQYAITMQLNDIAKSLSSCIKKKDTDAIIIPLGLFFETEAHANILIYRKKFNSIEHFEPHGKYFEGDAGDVVNPDDVIKKWLNYFLLALNRELKHPDREPITLIESEQVCPYLRGLQTLENLSSLIRYDDVEPKGYCAAWSMFFSELCLKNPEVTSSDLLKYVYKTLNDMNIIQQGNYLRSVIRGYVIFINEKIEKYFSIFNFNNSNLTIKKIKNMVKSDKERLYDIINEIINLEISMETNPLYAKENIARLKFKLKNMNKNNNNIIEFNDEFDEMIQDINKKIKIMKNYEKFNKLLYNPSMSDSEENKAHNICPEGKQINPKTGRCVKIKGKTQKNKSIKEDKAELQSKVCPEGKEINPKTGRCVKIKGKTQKNTPELQSKVCPEGKEINPKTGRCIKIKVKTQKTRT